MRMPNIDIAKINYDVDMQSIVNLCPFHIISLLHDLLVAFLLPERAYRAGNAARAAKRLVHYTLLLFWRCGVHSCCTSQSYDSAASL